jgi:hypothetical protein
MYCIYLYRHIYISVRTFIQKTTDEPPVGGYRQIYAYQYVHVICKYILYLHLFRGFERSSPIHVVPEYIYLDISIYSYIYNDIDIISMYKD